MRPRRSVTEQRFNLLMMNKSDVIINGKSIANLNRRIARHVMIFKFGIKDFSTWQAGQLLVNI